MCLLHHMSIGLVPHSGRRSWIIHCIFPAAWSASAAWKGPLLLPRKAEGQNPNTMSLTCLQKKQVSNKLKGLLWRKPLVVCMKLPIFCTIVCVGVRGISIVHQLLENSWSQMFDWMMAGCFLSLLFPLQTADACIKLRSNEKCIQHLRATQKQNNSIRS